MSTVNEAFYHRDSHDIVAMIYVVQVLFPIISSALLIGFYLYYWCIIQKDSLNYAAIDARDWSTVAAYYLVSFYFTFFVLGLDSAAVHYQRTSTEFITNSGTIRNLATTPIIFDLFAVIFIVVLLVISIKQIHDHLSDCCSNVDYKKWQVICLGLAGFAPLLCIASHAHFIVIAWTTGPSYAYGIGVFYAIIFFVHFFTFKFLYYVYASYGCCYKKSEEDRKEFSYVALLLTLLLGILLTGFFVMIACFVVLIPITESIEDASRQVSVIYQGIIFVLTALLAYLVIKPRQ